MGDLDIILTLDGSHSLRNNRLNETYHSIHGAIQESTHVFIEHGLSYFLKRDQPKPVHILEVGFGTGLNALLTVLYAETFSVPIHYTSLEPFPLTEQIYCQLNYSSQLDYRDAPVLFERLHLANWGVDETIAKNFVLKKQILRLEDFPVNQASYDVIYFDAFAPSRQQELWELSMLMKVENAMRPGAVFVTYCAKGQLKRDLRSVGLTVETVAGPPGKKEMVRAVKS